MNKIEHFMIANEYKGRVYVHFDGYINGVNNTEGASWNANLSGKRTLVGRTSGEC